MANQRNTYFEFLVVAKIGIGSEAYYIQFGLVSITLGDARADAENMLRRDEYFKKFAIQIMQIRLNAVKVERKKNEKDEKKDNKKS